MITSSPVPLNTEGGNFGGVVVVVVLLVVVVVVVVVVVDAADELAAASAACCRVDRPPNVTANISSTAMPAASQTTACEFFSGGCGCPASPTGSGFGSVIVLAFAEKVLCTSSRLDRHFADRSSRVNESGTHHPIGRNALTAPVNLVP
ncbi:hypothetical protein ACFWN2_34315 [Lentzea sp. NPDC058436]|uniref:hypothetical protein n=1 Tax=Lentzea sp. NPDC058436 TaxID=3346499 RepID=UPI00364A91BC